MARLEIDFGEIDDLFRDLSKIPDNVMTDSLNAMAKVGEQLVRSSGEAMGVRDPDSSVHILDHITHSKPKRTDGGGYCEVTFSGSRTRGKTTTKNSAIAFFNEYGKRGQPARPFIRTAAEQGADQIAAAGEKVVGAWFESLTN